MKPVVGRRAERGGVAASIALFSLDTAMSWKAATDARFFCTLVCLFPCRCSVSRLRREWSYRCRCGLACLSFLNALAALVRPAGMRTQSAFSSTKWMLEITVVPSIELGELLQVKVGLTSTVRISPLLRTPVWLPSYANLTDKFT